jgi:acyl-CoA synthetase (AMP-forming)/AMP-acid ligase II
MGIYDFTISDMIMKNNLLHPDKTAFSWGEDRWTFRQYWEDVNRVAAGLASFGIGKGDRMGILALNSYEYFLMYGAAAWLGAILLPVNWRLTLEEIQVIVEIVKPKIMAAGPEYLGLTRDLAENCPSITHRLIVGHGEEGFHSIHELRDANEAIERTGVTQKDPFMIIPTAAVEGKPRCAVLTHENLISANLQLMAAMGIDGDAVHLNTMPLFHIMGLEVSLSVMHAGGRNVIQNRFNAAEAAEIIDREKITIFPSVPPILSSILDEAVKAGRGLGSLRIVAGLADDPETVHRCQTMTGAQFWVGFGQSETTGYIALCPYDERPGSSGREGLLTRIRLVDEYDRDVEDGQPGEVIVRGPLVFQKYWDLDDQTAYTLREAWHHTGDICRLDGGGYLHYVRRKAEKELIKPGGENVYPAEVEKILLEHPDVREACVFGVPDKQWGEAIKAVCVLEAGSSLPERELIDFVGARIARYKKPKFVAFAESMPRLDDGTVDREKIKATYGMAQYGLV